MRIALAADKASPRGRELDPLRERPLYLRSLRAVLAVTTVIYAALLPDELRLSLLFLTVVSAAYLVATFGIEALSRWLTGGFYRWMFWLALGFDGAFLGAATYLSGGSTGADRYLVLVYLTVVTLLGTSATGLAAAVWQSLAQIGFFVAQWRNALDGFGSSADTELARLWAFLAALWVLTIATAILASVNQRELRRRRGEIDRLVDLGRDMENAEDAPSVGQLLLEALGDAFGYDRMVLFEVDQEIPRLLAASGLVPVREDALIDEESVIRKAIQRRETVRLDGIDETTDLWLSLTMPGVHDALVVPLVADGVVGVLVVALGPWAGRRSEKRVIAATERFAGHAAVALRSVELLQRVRQLAITDGLTQLSNRRAFDRALDREIGRASRSDGRLSVLLIDIDNFKALNDVHGHIAGDTVLRQTSRALQRAVRSYDTVARYGGEEFAAVLPGCSAGLAVKLADRIRLAVQDADTEVKVTASVGVATFPYDGADAAALLRSADRALYAAKRAGRNRVRSAEQARVELGDG
ncbi:MAG TPA: GGDEF domain-containing protein [Mycobacteriales bacterium]|jgi:diguanylate cyclase (GGDEF)-like protein|nr:GGDEF domain-containing protein [Mycobacteriales bacterium]